jgi:hypothetical protein
MISDAARNNPIRNRIARLLTWSEAIIPCLSDLISKLLSKDPLDRNVLDKSPHN